MYNNYNFYYSLDLTCVQDVFNLEYNLEYSAIPISQTLDFSNHPISHLKITVVRPTFQCFKHHFQGKSEKSR